MNNSFNNKGRDYARQQQHIQQLQRIVEQQQTEIRKWRNKSHRTQVALQNVHENFRIAKRTSDLVPVLQAKVQQMEDAFFVMAADSAEKDRLIQTLQAANTGAGNCVVQKKGLTKQPQTVNNDESAAFHSYRIKQMSESHCSAMDNISHSESDRSMDLTHVSPLKTSRKRKLTELNSPKPRPERKCRKKIQSYKETSVNLSGTISPRSIETSVPDDEDKQFVVATENGTGDGEKAYIVCEDIQQSEVDKASSCQSIEHDREEIKEAMNNLMD